MIDARDSFRQRPLWRIGNNHDITNRVNTLVAAVRADGDLVVGVPHGEPGAGGVSTRQADMWASCRNWTAATTAAGQDLDQRFTTNLAQLLIRHRDPGAAGGTSRRPRGPARTSAAR